MYCPRCNAVTRHHSRRSTDAHGLGQDKWWRCDGCRTVTYMIDRYGNQKPTSYDESHRGGSVLTDDDDTSLKNWPRPFPTVHPTHSETLYRWGIPFEQTAQHEMLRLPRLQDARAYDTAIRLPAQFGIADSTRDRLERAVFERARRDTKFLEALQAVLVARYHGGLESEAVFRFIDEQIPEPYERLWQRDLVLEDALVAVAAAARRLDSDGAGPLNVALAHLDEIQTKRGRMDMLRELLIDELHPTGEG